MNRDDVLELARSSCDTVFRETLKAAVAEAGRNAESRIPFGSLNDEQTTKFWSHLVAWLEDRAVNPSSLDTYQSEKARDLEQSLKFAERQYAHSGHRDLVRVSSNMLALLESSSRQAAKLTRDDMMALYRHCVRESGQSPKPKDARPRDLSMLDWSLQRASRLKILWAFRGWLNGWVGAQVLTCDTTAESLMKNSISMRYAPVARRFGHESWSKGDLDGALEWWQIGDHVFADPKSQVCLWFATALKEQGSPVPATEFDLAGVTERVLQARTQLTTAALARWDVVDDPRVLTVLDAVCTHAKAWEWAELNMVEKAILRPDPRLTGASGQSPSVLEGQPGPENHEQLVGAYISLRMAQEYSSRAYDHAGEIDPTKAPVIFQVIHALEHLTPDDIEHVTEQENRLHNVLLTVTDTVEHGDPDPVVRLGNQMVQRVLEMFLKSPSLAAHYWGLDMACLDLADRIRNDLPSQAPAYSRWLPEDPGKTSLASEPGADGVVRLDGCVAEHCSEANEAHECSRHNQTSKAPQVRADDVRKFILYANVDARSDVGEGIPPRAIEISRLCIIGDLDLSKQNLELPLTFKDCLFFANRHSVDKDHDEILLTEAGTNDARQAVRGRVLLDDAHILSIGLVRCTLGTLRMRSTLVDRDVTIEECSLTSINLVSMTAQGVRIAGLGCLRLSDRLPVCAHLKDSLPDGAKVELRFDNVHERTGTKEVLRAPVDARYLRCTYLNFDGEFGTVDLEQMTASDGIFLGSNAPMLATSIYVDRSDSRIVYSRDLTVSGALTAESANVTQNLFIEPATVVRGRLDLRGVRVQGPVYIGARVIGGPGLQDPSLDLRDCRIDGSVTLGNVDEATGKKSPQVLGTPAAPTLTGRVSLRGGKIDGPLTLSNIKAKCCSWDTSEVHPVHPDECKRTEESQANSELQDDQTQEASSEVRSVAGLRTVHVDAGLDLVGLEVNGLVKLRDVECEGRLLAFGIKAKAASFKGTNVYFGLGAAGRNYGPRPRHLSPAALDMERSVIERKLSVRSCIIDGDLSLEYSSAYSVTLGEDDDRPILRVCGAIRATGATVAGVLSIEAISCPAVSEETQATPFVRLTDADVAVLSLSARFDSDAASAIRVSGARLGSVRIEGVDATSPVESDDKVYLSARRLANLQKSFDGDSASDMPWDGAGYESLAGAVAAAGNLDGALDIAVIGENARDRYFKWPVRLGWRPLLRWATDYGYRPAKPLWIAITAVLVATALVVAGWLQGWFRLVSHPSVLTSSPDSCPPSDGVCFAPVAYLLDVLIPPLDLSQESSWTAVSPWLTTVLAICTFLAWTLFVLAAVSWSSSSRRLLVKTSRGEG